MSGTGELSKVHFGARIEAQAELWFLQQRPSARLLERNFRWRGGEIDLIFEESREEGVELVFVEVRARLPGSWVGGIESVQGAKLRRLRNGMELYLARYRGKARSVRLDLLAWDGARWEHLPNAWT